MANTLEYAKLFQEMLDDQMVAELTSAWMEGNASLIRYSGGNEVKIPKMEMTGLKDYNRATGFVAGSVTLEFVSYAFDKDRGTTFNLDSQDVDETNFVATATSVMTEFQKDEVVPEVDAYRYSKVFERANTVTQTTAYTPAAATIFGALKADIAQVQDITGEKEPLVIVMSIPTASILDQADKIDKTIRYDEFTMGEDSQGKRMATMVGYLDNIPIIRVPSLRMKSKYTFTAAGDGGFVADSNALNINWEIIARRSVFGIVKQDKMRIFDPDTNQTADAYKMDYRKYHTLIVPDNKLAGVHVNYTPSAAPALAITVAGGTASGSTKYTATPTGANTLAYKITDANTEDGSIGIKPAGVTAYTSGADIAGVTAGQWLNAYELDAAGLIVKFVAYELQAGDITA